MKKINILILDDNFVIANKIKKRLFEADNSYRYNSGIQIFPYYLEVDNDNPFEAAKVVNNYIKENEIQYLLLDRGFGKIIEPTISDSENLNNEYLYKDNTVVGYFVENLLKEINKIKHNELKNIKGVIVYTYDDYRELKKESEIVKEEIINELISILPKRCSVDVLLSYSNLYKTAGVSLYECYSGEGTIRLGRKEHFLLYGLFMGELLYHKLLQMINARTSELIKNKQMLISIRIVVLYLIFISINIGANALYSSFFQGKNVLIVVSIFFSILIPFVILFFKPSLLIDLE
jgi:hypothetical protein